MRDVKKTSSRATTRESDKGAKTIKSGSANWSSEWKQWAAGLVNGLFPIGEFETRRSSKSFNPFYRLEALGSPEVGDIAMVKSLAGREAELLPRWRELFRDWKIVLQESFDPPNHNKAWVKMLDKVPPDYKSDSTQLNPRIRIVTTSDIENIREFKEWWTSRVEDPGSGFQDEESQLRMTIRLAHEKWHDTGPLHDLAKNLDQILSELPEQQSANPPGH